LQAIWTYWELDQAKFSKW